MKLLLDQNLSRRLVPVLDTYFPDTTQVALIELDKVFDIYIWEYAKDNEFIIVTKDSDFEELSILYGSPPKVIWIKLGNVSNKVILEALIDNRELIRETLNNSDINCLEIY